MEARRKSRRTKKAGCYCKCITVGHGPDAIGRVANLSECEAMYTEGQGRSMQVVSPEHRVTISGVRRFWRLAELMRASKEPWIPTAGYELRKSLVVASERWCLCLKLHAAIDAASPEVIAQHEFSQFHLATVTIWPPAGRPRPGDVNSRRAIAKALRSRGYEGEWRKFPGHQRLWGDFELRLESMGAIRTEKKWFEAVGALGKSAPLAALRPRRRGAPRGQTRRC